MFSHQHSHPAVTRVGHARASELATDPAVVQLAFRHVRSHVAKVRRLGPPGPNSDQIVRVHGREEPSQRRVLQRSVHEVVRPVLVLLPRSGCLPPP